METFVANFGSRFPFSTLFFCLMPAIAVPDLVAWAVWARWWRSWNPGVDPAELTVSARRHSIAARAAWWFSLKLEPPAIPCEACGAVSFSWCEGCYARSATAEPLGLHGSVCTECNSQRLVCGYCRAQSVSWEQGHDTFLRQHGATSATTPVEVSEVEARQPSASSILSVPTVPATSGLSPDELAQQTHGGFTKGGSSSRGSRSEDGPNP